MRSSITIATFSLLLASLSPLSMAAGSSNEELMSTNVATREAAMSTLRDEKDLNRLSQLMKHKEFRLRKAAISTMHVFVKEADAAQHDKAKEILAQSLNDSSPIIRFEAAQILATWNDHRGNNILINNLEHTNPWRRLQSAKALFVTADPRAIPHLIANLRDHNYNIREACMNSLRKISGENFNYNPILPEHIVLSDAQQKQLRQKYRELFDSGATASDPEALSKANAAYNKACEDMMQAHTAKYSKIRETAIANWRTWWVDNQNGKRLEWLKKGLNHQNPATRQMAIESLESIMAIEAHDAIVEKLQDKSFHVVVAACQTLGKFKQKASISPLINLMKETNTVDESKKAETIKNFAAYNALKTITQGNFYSLFSYWEKWWALNNDYFTIGVDLPVQTTHNNFNIRVISIDNDKATFEIRYYYAPYKEWVKKNYTLSIDQNLGKRNQEHIFDDDGIKIQHFFDFRSGLRLISIDGNSVTLRTADQEFTQDEEKHTFKGDSFTIRINE